MKAKREFRLVRACLFAIEEKRKRKNRQVVFGIADKKEAVAMVKAVAKLHGGKVVAA